jgi:two-component system, OmpR family, phosphate regulon sensor histidine kinase PhoR
LEVAVQQEMDIRHQRIVAKFKTWLADTSFIEITCDNKNRNHETVFHMRDAHPIDNDRLPVSIGLKNFKQSLSEITPEAKSFFIEHFGNTILMGDLKKGIIYFYTQRIGDSLTVAYDNSKLNFEMLDSLYQRELNEKNVHAVFELNPDTTYTQDYNTKLVNTALRRPYEKEFVMAGFESPSNYFLKAMKWVLGSTLFLISITLFCFAYTVKTLLSQQKLAELKDNFINNMTHELNTPLASIRITAEALRTLEHDRETEREYLDIIQQQTERLTGLTSKILDTNRMISQQTEWVVVDLNSLIQEAVKSINPQFNANHGTIKFEPISPILIKVEAGGLVNAFINIMDNALKYSAGPAELEIKLFENGNHALLSFADNGVGVTETYRDKIFEQFFRVPNGNTHNVKGYGLGLSYVKQVIAKHKGVLSVSANHPRGSVFNIKLPLS